MWTQGRGGWGTKRLTTNPCPLNATLRTFRKVGPAQFINVVGYIPYTSCAYCNTATVLEVYTVETHLMTKLVQRPTLYYDCFGLSPKFVLLVCARKKIFKHTQPRHVDAGIHMAVNSLCRRWFTSPKLSFWSQDCVYQGFSLCAFVCSITWFRQWLPLHLLLLRQIFGQCAGFTWHMHTEPSSQPAMSDLWNTSVICEICELWSVKCRCDLWTVWSLIYKICEVW